MIYIVQLEMSIFQYQIRILINLQAKIQKSQIQFQRLKKQIVLTFKDKNRLYLEKTVLLVKFPTKIIQNIKLLKQSLNNKLKNSSVNHTIEKNYNNSVNDLVSLIQECNDEIEQCNNAIIKTIINLKILSCV